MKVLLVEDSAEELEHARNFVDNFASMSPEDIVKHTKESNYCVDILRKPMDDSEKAYAQKRLEEAKERYIPVIQRFLSTNTLEVLYAKTLCEALCILKGTEVDIVLTDVFYPVGQKPKPMLLRNLGLGLLYAHAKQFFHQEEIDAYLIELAKGMVPENEVPSGVVLALYALSRGIYPVLISSFEHHAKKTNAIIALCRGGAGNPVFSEGSFFEGLNEDTGRKQWEKAIVEIILVRNFGGFLPGEYETARKLGSEGHHDEIADLLGLPERLHNYLDF